MTYIALNIVDAAAAAGMIAAETAAVYRYRTLWLWA